MALVTTSDAFVSNSVQLLLAEEDFRGGHDKFMTMADGATGNCWIFELKEFRLDQITSALKLTNRATFKVEGIDVTIYIHGDSESRVFTFSEQGL